MVQAAPRTATAARTMAKASRTATVAAAAQHNALAKLRSHKQKHDRSKLLSLLTPVFLLGGLGLALYIPTMRRAADPTVSTIDLSVLTGGSAEARQAEAHKLHGAMKSLGVFYAVGLPAGAGAVVARATRSAERFFAQPAASKSALRSRKKAQVRGYIGVGDESGSDLVEVKEAFSYGSAANDAGSERQSCGAADVTLAAPNVWPDKSSAPDFRADMEAIYELSSAAAESVAEGFAVALGLGREHFAKLCDARSGPATAKRISLMRLFHYLPDTAAPAGSEGKRTGSSPHTDWGFLTLVFSREPGLQMRHRNRWVSVPVGPPGSAVVNCGDWLSLQHAEVISPRHRVVGRNATADRLSFVYFGYPNFDATFDTSLSSGDKKSILTDQRRPEERAAEQQRGSSPATFGAWIASKWEEVSRK